MKGPLVTPPPVTTPTRAVMMAIMALLVAIWGTTWAAVRLSLSGFPPLVGASLRFLLASIVVVALAKALRQPLAGDRRLRWIWPLQAVLTFGVSYGVVYWAEQWVPSGLVSVLFATFPLFVVLYARVLLPDERISRFAVLGLVAGFCGVAVIFSEDMGRLGGAKVQLACLVMLLSPASAALANVMVKRWGQGLSPYALIAGPMAMSGVGLGLLAMVFERGRPIDPAPVPVAAVLYLAVIGSAVTFTLYFWLLERIPATKLSMIAYGTPVIAVVLGVWAFDEPITVRIVAGGLLVIVGVVLVLRVGVDR
jgi:drug/metabolite transporter (DMT)-like permease